MQTGVGERFRVVLGADGLGGRRSDVGRVTVELACALRLVPAVAVAVAELGLLVGGDSGLGLGVGGGAASCAVADGGGAGTHVGGAVSGCCRVA